MLERKSLTIRQSKLYNSLKGSCCFYEYFKWIQSLKLQSSLSSIPFNDGWVTGVSFHSFEINVQFNHIFKTHCDFHPSNCKYKTTTGSLNIEQAIRLSLRIHPHVERNTLKSSLWQTFQFERKSPELNPLLKLVTMTAEILVEISVSE